LKPAAYSLPGTWLKFAACALVLLVACGASAADEPEGAGTQGAASTANDAWATFWKHLQIRQNTNVKKDIAKPAFVTLTIPDEGDRTYQIGFGALASVLSTQPGRSRRARGLSAEFRRRQPAGCLQGRRDR
jgi:hypothetical protein